MKILAVIPARGGSKGIPRKNVRLMAGKPLIAYSIENAIKCKYDIDVVVSTDNEEISRIATNYGVTVIERPLYLSTDEVTLDPVISHAVEYMESIHHIQYNIVITMQPTSPLLKVLSLNNAIDEFVTLGYDTILSVINKPHLSWTEENGRITPMYKERLNRQYLPKSLQETGAFLISKREFINKKSRIGPKVSVFEISETESIDIDTPQDWWVAEKELNKKNIIIRVEGYSEIGLGHIYRGLLIAHNFIDHNIEFVISVKSDLGIKKLKESNLSFTVIEKEQELFDIMESTACNILVNDILDTSSEYIKKCKSLNVRVINFEDLGTGAEFADAVINDLYEKKNELKNHYWGSEYYCIRDEFLLSNQVEFKEKVSDVLILFGGTDPLNLTERLIKIIDEMECEEICFTFILGLGYKKYTEIMNFANGSNKNIKIVQDVKIISEYMSKADIAISSQGRTMLELATIGVPTILIAQNERELHHEFGYMKNGFINLGLGKTVEDDSIKETLTWIINSKYIRQQMSKYMKSVDTKSGISRVKNIILGKEL